jgi:hypothetical protein
MIHAIRRIDALRHLGHQVYWVGQSPVTSAIADFSNENTITSNIIAYSYAVWANRMPRVIFSAVEAVAVT